MAEYGKILEIKEVRDPGEGYRITTDKTVIEFIIAGDQYCCESYGYFSSDDDLSRVIGKEIADIGLWSEKEGTYEVPTDAQYFECGGICFITFRLTDGDSFQLAVYNSHNGYYGHDICMTIGDSVVINSEL